MMALQEEALPCHFGSNNELFGLYHAPGKQFYCALRWDRI